MYQEHICVAVICLSNNHKWEVKELLSTVIEFIDDKYYSNKDAQTHVFIIDTIIFIFIKLGV